MLAFGRVHIHGPRGKEFDVIKAFSELDSSRKLVLCDHLNDSPSVFNNTVMLLWPQATRTDSKELERYIVERLAVNENRH